MSVSGGADDLSGDAPDDPVLVELVAELADRIEAGGAVDLEQLVRQYPEWADQLRRMLPTIERMAHFEEPTALLALHDFPEISDLAPPGPSGCLGDFRILREIGRGGMGIVYEALQLSLNRRVALKVLPAAATLDPRQLERFRLEAQAVACLNHPRVVPVFFVGRDRGIHYYVMPLIEGQSLAQVIRELRELEQGDEAEPAGAVSVLTRSIASGRFSSDSRDSGDKKAAAPDPGRSSGPATPPPKSQGPEPTGSTEPPPGKRVAAPSTSRSAFGRAFFRTVARFGRQAAEALDHAHQREVLHRDIKPANLIVDRAGDLWVTDFGLARLHGSDEFSRSGDFMGTLRYMSPEHAMGRRATADHRTDIYSLGVTLYEFLTLSPAFVGEDRQEILRRIASEEPVAPRSLKPSIPADLETILLKAMAKEPADRYATAQDLADDLGRFLEDRPILARRPTLRDRAVKLGRRHKRAVATTATLAMLAVMALTVAGWWSSAWFHRHNTALRKALDMADRFAIEARRHQTLAEGRALVATQRLYASRVRQAQHALEEGHVERAQELLRDGIPGPGQRDLRDFAWHYLWQLACRDFDLLSGHDAPVHSLSLAPDRRTLASGDRTGVVILWDLDTRRRLASLKVGTGHVERVEFSPDAKALAILAREEGRDDCTLGLWELRAKPGPAPRGEPRDPAHAPVETGPAGEIRPGSDEEGSARLTRRWHRTEVRSFVSAHDGGHLITADADGRVRLLRAEDGSEVATFPGVEPRLSHLILSPDGTLLAGGADRDKVILWDVATRREPRIIEDESSREQGIILMAFSLDQKSLATLSLPSRSLRLREVATGRELPAPPASPQAFFSSLAFSPDGQTLAIGGKEFSFRLWDLAAGRERGRFHGRTGTVWSTLYTPDGRDLIVGGDDPAIRIWHLDRRPEPPALRGHRIEAWAVAFTADSRTLISSSDDHTIKFWDPATGLERPPILEHGSLVAALAVGLDGRTLASGGFDRTVRLWDLPSGALRRELTGPTGPIRCVAIAPDGGTVAAGGSDPRIHLWDAGTGRLNALLEGRTTVHTVAFSPDGKILASAGDDRTVRLWDTAGLGTLRTLAGRNQIKSVAFSPDGVTLAAADKDGVVTLWDVATGAHRASLKGPAAEALSVAFSPDGRLIAVACGDGTVRLWNRVAAQELLVLRGHGNRVRSVAFAPDGRTLASCDHDGAIKLWSAGPR
jgi:WD40 repeat protein/serine/threonine protein kinase